MAFLCSVLSYIGAVAVMFASYRFVNFLRVNYFVSTDLKRKYAKAGDWAVVTGATEGIGHAMALELACRGFNVCVIARTKSKLEEVVSEIEKKGVSGKSVVFDFAAAGDEEYKQLFQQLNGLGIAVLVNNVGVNYTYANYFDEADIQDDLRIIKVNCEATVRMTKYVAPHMKARGAGGIVTLASFTSIAPAPMLATYAGSKAFSKAFGESLAFELGPAGVDVLVVTPNLVVSRMTQGASSRKPKESFLMVGAAAMARQTLNKLGVVTCTSGHSNHVIVESITKLLPKSFVGTRVLKMHQGIKKRAERKRTE
ncbi:Short-chain dehydrogenase/reductase SDR [Trypanosoma melophagium]|uniref:Short-chain dehydrogenase/reductase SDR n=1 Tax=Trypanosoma melophagium TaxID=715481 RepID=UPI00351A1F69|nr:Short-chain dehydrogenase/reductase SDR [Trypanosoma melophagium]